MGTKARIATVCQGGQFKPTVEENLEYILGLVDMALREKPDLVCLPEAFHDVGVRKPLQETAEPLSGPTITACARKARQAGCYIVCPIHTLEDGRVYNSAVVLDRNGEVAGIYHKVCPVTSSADYTVLEQGITPGDSLPILDLDLAASASRSASISAFRRTGRRSPTRARGWCSGPRRMTAGSPCGSTLTSTTTTSCPPLAPAA